MRKKVVGGIVLGAVILACCAVLVLTKETKQEDEIVEKEIKKVEKPTNSQTQKTSKSQQVKKVEKEGSRMKGKASILLDDSFAVHDIRIIEGDNGLFIARPSRKTATGEYKDIKNAKVYENYSSLSRYQTKKEKSGCFIATAVYQDYDAPEVIVLRKFRDKKLNRCLLGRVFIKVYYFISPMIANLLSNHKIISKFIKYVLDKTVKNIKM